MAKQSCSKCKKTFPATTEFFYKVSQKARKANGLHSWCKDCFRAKQRGYRNKNIQRERQRCREYHEKNRDKQLRYMRHQYQIKRADRIEKVKEYCKTDKYRAWRKAFNKTPKRKLWSHITATLSKSFKGKRQTSKSLLNAFGYTMDELKIHLERQFLPGMSWDNYGEWHIDHIRPVSSFNYESVEDEQFKQCWALSNLRPLWAADNLKKSAQQIYLV